MVTQPAQPQPIPARKKSLIRRFAPDRSQRTRHIVQALFLVVNAWLGLQFYLWARYYERGGVGPSVPRPAGVEGWLPIAGLMNTKYFLLTGHVPQIHPAAMFLFIGFMLMSLLLKKAFCSWLCPVGTFSEFLWKIGRRIFGRNLRLPRWFDISLRSLKYVLLGLFVAVIGAMSASRSRRLHGDALWSRRRREDAEFLPRHRDYGSRGHRLARASFHAGAEFLVPLSMPLRRAHGIGFPAKPG